MADTGLKKKIGPLPMWAWGLIAGVAAYYFYKRYTENQSATTSPTSGVLDPNAIDPNTGLTYGQEENAAYQQMATSGTGAGGYAGSYPTQGPSIGQELTDVTGLITSLENAGLIPSPTTTNAGSGSSSDQAAAAAAAAAAGSNASTAPPPVNTTNNYVTNNYPPASSPSSAPTTNPSPVTQPPPSIPATLSPTQLASSLLTSAGVAGSQATTYLSGLLSGGYKKVAGSTQSGGLAQTGTYTRAGGPTYYVWGTNTTGLHIRQAVTSTGTINAPGQPTPAGGFRP